MSLEHNVVETDVPDINKIESITKDELIVNGKLDYDLWLAWRIQTRTNLFGTQIPQKLGASDAGEICGLCGASKPPYRPYTTPTQKWLNMLGRTTKRPITPAMTRGHTQEPLIALEYEKLYGPTTITSVWVGPSWLAVSPDRLIPGGVLEIKSSDCHNIKLEWICQITYQLAVLQRSFAHLAVCNLDAERRLHIYEIKFSKTIWAWIYKRMDYFYKCLLTEEEPIHLPYIKKEFKRCPSSKEQTPLGLKLFPWNHLKVKIIYDQILESNSILI